MIHSKWEEPVKAEMGERARGWRRRDLEKKMISAMREGVSLEVCCIGEGRLTFTELTIHLSAKDVEKV